MSTPSRPNISSFFNHRLSTFVNDVEQTISLGQPFEFSGTDLEIEFRFPQEAEVLSKLKQLINFQNGTVDQIKKNLYTLQDIGAVFISSESSRSSNYNVETFNAQQPMLKNLFTGISWNFGSAHKICSTIYHVLQCIGTAMVDQYQIDHKVGEKKLKIIADIGNQYVVLIFKIHTEAPRNSTVTGEAIKATFFVDLLLCTVTFHKQIFHDDVGKFVKQSFLEVTQMKSDNNLSECKKLNIIWDIANELEVMLKLLPPPPPGPPAPIVPDIASP
jgi:hypothetical protein